MGVIETLRQGFENVKFYFIDTFWGEAHRSGVCKFQISGELFGRFAAIHLVCFIRCSKDGSGVAPRYFGVYE